MSSSDKFDPFDGRSVRLKTNAALKDGKRRVSQHLKQCSASPDGQAHAKMWRAILADINSEIVHRKIRT